MCEEVKQPATQVPKAMVGTIVLNMICGFIFLVPLCFVLPPIEDLIVLAQPFPYIMAQSVGNEAGAFVLCLPIMILGIFCGVGCTTASSRCVWAFARDGAIPGFQLWKQVNKRLDVPLNAMMLLMVCEIALGLIYFGSTAAFNGFSGAGVIFLTIAYVMPIAVSLLGGRKALKNGVYDFGAFGIFCNVVSIGKSLRSICDYILTLCSLDSACHTTLLDANLPASSRHWYELRICCVRRRCSDIGHMVSRLGTKELSRSTGCEGRG